jgi:hypothetical protein
MYLGDQPKPFHHWRKFGLAKDLNPGVPNEIPALHPLLHGLTIKLKILLQHQSLRLARKSYVQHKSSKSAGIKTKPFQRRLFRWRHRLADPFVEAAEKALNLLLFRGRLWMTCNQCCQIYLGPNIPKREKIHQITINTFAIKYIKCP